MSGLFLFSYPTLGTAWAWGTRDGEVSFKEPVYMLMFSKSG